MIIAQITDFHVALPGTELATRYRTPERLQAAVRHLAGMDPAPDMVVCTGDLVDKGSEDEYRLLGEILSPLAMPVFLIPGNHDRREGMRAVFTDHTYLPAADFLHYTVEDWPVRLIGLDTIIPGESGGLLCEARLAWLEARLAEAPDRPTLIFQHHPPFRTGVRKMDGMGLAGSDEEAAIIARFDNIEAVICGHLHRPIARRFHGTIASTCPGTAHQIALNLSEVERLGVVDEPPACQLHVWNGEDGLVSHTSYIETYGEPLIVFDGQEWVRS